MRGHRSEVGRARKAVLRSELRVHVLGQKSENTRLRERTRRERVWGLGSGKNKKRRSPSAGTRAP